MDWPQVPVEIAQHLDDRYEELRSQGLSPAQARTEVLAELGDDGVRELNGSPTRRRAWADVLPDTRYALRWLRKNPAFTVVTVLTLALGIGANTAIFSVVNAVLIRPLPYDPSSRLVAIWGDLRRPGLNEIPGSAGEFVDYRTQNRTFEYVAAYDTDGFNLSGDGGPERIEGAVVTPSLFPLLGATAKVGRTMLPDDDRPGREAVVVLSHALWSRRFRSDPAIVGRAIQVDGRPMLVAGIMPADFHFPDATTEIWKPILLDSDAVSDNNRGSHGYTILAKMKAGVTLQQAHADVSRIADGFQAAHPNNYRKGFGVTLRPWRDEIVGSTDRPLLMLLAAVGLVLLIACANVASLLMARGAARAKEIALRTALGASRGRLVRQLLTESVSIAVLGGIGGALFARWSVRLIAAVAPDGIPRIREVTLDFRVLLFTSVLSLATGLMFGIIPALKSTEFRRPAAGRPPTTSLLVVGEVALSLVLLVAGGLLIGSFLRLENIEPGFRSSNLLTFRLSLPSGRYATFEQGDRFFDRLLDSLRSNPAVSNAAAVQALPFSGIGGSRSFFIQGREIRRPEDQPEDQLRIVTDGYFDAMKIPIRDGREFTVRDTLAAPRVAAVNEAFARKYFGEGTPIGARVAFTKDDPHWYEIVAVVGNVKHRALDAADRAELYVPYKQPLFDGWTVRPMYFVVRSPADMASVAATVRQQIARLDPDQPIADVRTMDERIDESLASRRFSMVLLSSFAAFALALAAIGLYGVLSYSVSQRTREIGVRIALGAQRGDVLRLVVREGLTLGLIGTAVGLAAALAAARAISSLLFAVGAADPATYLSVSGIVLAATAIACYLPARRATRVEAMVALRQN